MKIQLNFYLFFIIFCYEISSQQAYNHQQNLEQFTKYTSISVSNPIRFIQSEKSSQQAPSSAQGSQIPAPPGLILLIQGTYITYKTWSEDLQDSMTESMIGLFLFLFSFPFLWYNERRAIRTYEILLKAYNLCKEGSPQEIISEFQDYLVHMSGKTSVQQKLTDQALNMTIPIENEPIKLNRKVEMFINIEHVKEKKVKNTIGGGHAIHRSYHYTQEWSQNDPQQVFNNPQIQNPGQGHKFVQNEKWQQSQVRLGEFSLSSSQINQINNFQIIQSLNENEMRSNIESLVKKQSLNGQFARLIFQGPYIYIRFSEGVYDTIGDLRISYEYVACGDITIVSQQNDNTFKPFVISKQKENQQIQDDDLNTGNNSCCFLMCIPILAESLCKEPSEIDWVYTKKLTKKEVFTSEQSKNEWLTSLARIGGFFFMWIGLYLIFSPLYSLLKIIPLLDVLGKYVIGITAFIITMPLSLLVIAVSWIMHRPIFGLILMTMITLWISTIIILFIER